MQCEVVILKTVTMIKTLFKAIKREMVVGLCLSFFASGSLQSKKVFQSKRNPLCTFTLEQKDWKSKTKDNQSRFHRKPIVSR